MHRGPSPASFVAHVGARNQITIPKAIVDLLQLDTASYVRVEITRLEREGDED